MAENGSQTQAPLAIDQIIIRPPFTMEFDITRSCLGGLNRANIRLYNLSPETRSLLLKDQWNLNLDRKIILQAGYGDSVNLPIVFAGNLVYCWSTRQGPDTITQIEAQDGGFAAVRGFVSLEFPGGTAQLDIIKSLSASLQKFGITPGAVGSYTGTTSRGSSYSGNPMSLLKELTGGGFFVDSLKSYCLQDQEVFAPDWHPPLRTSFKPVAVISSDTGMIGTPIAENSQFTFNTLFEPQLEIGRLVQVQSSSSSFINRNGGFYKINFIHHQGVISDAVCGDATTTLQCWASTGEFSPVGPL